MGLPAESEQLLNATSFSVLVTIIGFAKLVTFIATAIKSLREGEMGSVGAHQEKVPRRLQCSPFKLFLGALSEKHICSFKICVQLIGYLLLSVDLQLVQTSWEPRGLQCGRYWFQL